MNVSHHAIKRRLLDLQTPTGQPYNLLLVRYAQERALYRISKSKHVDRFMIKGGMLVTSLTANLSRATRDIDARAEFDISIEGTRAIVNEALSISVEPDGLEFLVAEMTLERLDAGSDYGGVRCLIPVALGKERVSIQIDLSVGHSVYQPMHFDFPTLIDGLPPARLLAYSRESVIAEKLEAIAKLGDENGRYRDFADIVTISENFDFRAGPLWTAIEMTFGKRGTDFGTLAAAIDPSAATDERERHYAIFRRRDHAHGAPPSLAECMTKIGTFLEGARMFGADATEREWDKARRIWGAVEI